MSIFSWIGYYSEREFFQKVAFVKNIAKGPIREGEEDEIILNLKPIEAVYLKDICSKTGAKTEGSLIISPILLKQLPMLSKEQILQKVNSSVELALLKKSDVICLAGALGEFAPAISAKLKGKAKIVTGRKFLSATIIDNIEAEAKAAGKKLEDEKIAIFDLSTNISRVLAQALAKKAKEIRIFDKQKRNKSAFNELKDIPEDKLKISDNIGDILKGSKFVIVTSLFVPEKAINLMEKGSVVFDAIVPFWAAKVVSRARPDIIAVESAWATKGPLIDKKELDLVFPDDAIFGCIAESAMLGLEDNIEQEWLELSPDNIEVMREIGTKHGFIASSKKRIGEGHGRP